MSLSMAREGEQVVLKNIAWGEKLKRRLQDMGLTPGVKFSIISSNTNGSLIINLRGSRLVLGRGMAQKILVDVA